MKYVRTKEARYVPGTDHTLCGSRSGANAVAVWMILHSHGSDGWRSKIRSLVDRTSDLCSELDQLGIHYYRNPHINIIAIPASDISPSLAAGYFLVADSYEQPAKWWKIVMMPHITRGISDKFINDLKAERKHRTAEV
jgi:glutamate/tyrosine decarboxylase-like PLP-dependent enzyme